MNRFISVNTVTFFMNHQSLFPSFYMSFRIFLSYFASVIISLMALLFSYNGTSQCLDDDNKECKKFFDFRTALKWKRQASTKNLELNRFVIFASNTLFFLIFLLHLCFQCFFLSVSQDEEHKRQEREMRIYFISMGKI